MAKEKTTKKDTNTQIGPNETLTLNFVWAEIEPSYNQALAKYAQKVKLPGFRPGKVPPQIAEAQLDPERLAQQALQKLLPLTYEAELKKAKKEPIIQPEFVLVAAEKGKDWIVEAHFATTPVIDLKDYKKIISDAKKTALKEIKEQEAQKAKAKTEKAAEAKKALSKKEVGEKADVIEMDPGLEPLTDEQISNQVLDRSILALREELQPVMPEILVKKQAERQLQEMLEQLKQFNIELEDYLKNTGNTFEAFADELSQDALRRLQVDFIMQSLMDAEKITATPEAIHAEFDQIFAAEKEKNHLQHCQKECKCPSQEEYTKLQAEREADPYYQAYVTDLIKRRDLIEKLKALK